MGLNAKVTSKGQITLPAELRKALGLKPGDTVNFRKTESGNYELVTKPLRFEDLRGIVPYDGPALTDEDIVDMVRQARDGRAAEIVGRMRKK
jgi:AbrB family looped-hinge helix DNA binding protein